MRVGVVAVLACALLGCPDAHSNTCSPTEPCPAGSGCDRTAAGYVCVARCTLSGDGRFCLDGSVCVSYGGPFLCRRGGTVGEGETVGVGAATETCAAGLAPANVYTEGPIGEPPRIRQTCQRACDDREGRCRAGENCREDGTCGPACDGIGCGPDAYCVTYRTRDYCVDARRRDRMDCDADGEPDCPAYARCDGAAVGGCAAVPPEET